MSKMFFWTQGRNYGKSQFFKHMREEMRMSRNKEVPMEPTEGFEITEVTTNKYRTLPVINGIVMLDSDETIRSVTEKRKEDPAIYNPENLIHGSVEDYLLVGKEMTKGFEKGLNKHNDRFDSISEAVRSLQEKPDKKTAAEWRQDKLVKQDQAGELFDMERYNYIRTEPDALITKEEWELVFNPIKESKNKLTNSEINTLIENQSGLYIVPTGEAYAGVIEELSETYIKKNSDYGNSFEKTLDKRGLIPAIVRMEEKMERMEQLWETEKTLVDDESIIDSAMDLANYAIMTAMWLKKKQINTNNAKYGGADFDGDTIKISDKEIGSFNFPIGQQFNSNDK